MKVMRETNRPEIKLLREDNHQLRYLTMEEEERWLRILAEGWSYLYDIITVALGTGLRRSELFRLEKAHIDFAQDVIHVLQTKSGRPRQVPIGKETRSVLERLCEESKSKYVFTSYRTGDKFDDVKGGIAKTCELAGIEGVTLHPLRHTYGTRLAAAGVDVAVIKDLMGHSSISTTQRYVHAIAESKHQAVQKLSDYKNRCKIVAMKDGKEAVGGTK
jgi:integrase